MTAPWRQPPYTNPCPTCGAQPGQLCQTKTGRKAYNPHTTRQPPNTNHCPTCGTPTPQPAEYCRRCQLLRDLNTERATYHQRET